MRIRHRIIMVTDHLKSECGPTTTFLAFYSGLKKIIDVYVLTGDDNGTQSANHVLEGKKYFFLKSSDRYILGSINILTVIRTFFELPKILTGNGIEVVYSFLYSAALGVAILKWSKIIKQKWIYNFSGPLHLETKSSYLTSQRLHLKKRVLIFWQYLVLHFILRNADTVIARSSYAANILRTEFNLPEEKIAIIEGTVDPCIFNSGSSNSNNLPVFNSKQKILFIASRLEYRKGVDIAIKALALLVKEISDIVLLVAIPKSHFSDIDLLTEYFDLIDEHKLAGKVFFTRGVEHSQMPSLYRQASVTLVCSRDFETFGLTTIESLACGTPVIGSDSGATPDILNRIDPNLLFKSGDSDSLAKRVSYFLSLDNKGVRLLRQNMEIAVSNYSLSLQVDKLVSIIKGIRK